MGCCCSSEANAKETDIPPPEWGAPIKCHLKSQGMFSADYDVCIGGPDGDVWMLLDAVGGFFDEGYSYFLKHRATGQVDADGQATSTVLGAVNIKGEWDAFSFKVVGADGHLGIGPVFDLWDGDFDLGISSERQLWAAWTYSKRAVIYSDYEMTKQAGMGLVAGIQWLCRGSPGN
jgi:hypothetical protein